MEDTPRKPDRLRFYLLISLGLHLGVLGTALIGQALYPRKTLVLRPTLRVDLIGLPDLKKSEIAQLKITPPVDQKSEPPSEPEKKESEPLKEPIKKAPQDTRSDLLSLLKSVKKEPPSKKTAVQKKSKTQPTSNLATNDFQNLIKGNVISKGNSLNGDYSEGGELFAGDLQQHIQSNWNIPPWLKRLEISATVRIHLNQTGELMGYVFLKRSGNAQFDAAVERALQKSNPFPKPPEELLDQIRRDGIKLGFPL